MAIAFDSNRCPVRHTAHDGRQWRIGDDDLVAIRYANGNLAVRAVCDCGHETGDLPTSALPAPRESYPVVRDNRFRYNNKPCEVKGCGSDYTEFHHFAPRAVFGQFRANDWPGGYLCRVHHAEWHTSMEGYRWRQ